VKELFLKSDTPAVSLFLCLTVKKWSGGGTVGVQKMTR
jgi:hypothetical protein